MKKFSHLQKSLFALLLALFVGMGTAYAADFSKVYQGQTFYFNITDATNHYVEITYPATDWEDEPWEGYTKPTGNITLPSSVSYNGTTYVVKAIGWAAFYNCSGLIGSLTIPNSVTTIVGYAFAYCSGFTGSLTIPNSVTSIGDKAFYYCSGFNGSLFIGNSVTSIGNYAFNNCSGFTGSLTLGSSLTSIGYAAFAGCSGFTGSLTIPNSMTEVSGLAFGSCSGFTGTLTIPSSVTELGNSTFRDCSGFTHVVYNATNCADSYQYSPSFENCGGTLTIGNNVTRIPSYMFKDSDFTGSLTIPNSVTMIGDHAFRDCSGFTGSLTIGNSVTSIGENAFSGCSGLTGSLTIPNSVTTIGYAAFYSCSGFTGSLTIGNSVTTIGFGAFQGCSGFTGNLIIPNSVTTIDRQAFHSCSGFTGSLSISSSVTTIGDHTFYGCSGFTGSLTIPNSVTTIGYAAFYSCSGFTGSLTIPNSVTEVGEVAFNGCNGFNGSLSIGNSVELISRRAFYGCSGFTGTLTIGNSVTSIGEKAFYNCPNLSLMIVLPDTPPTLGNYAFYNVPTDIPVYVPCESLEDYQAASGWSAFTNMQCRETLTVYDGTATNFQIPAYITYFDDFTRSQFVIPADELVEMIGTPITSMTFYTTTQNMPYTTLSDADVYLMEVDYTSISAYEPKESATTVYSGRFSIVSADDGGGMMTINFSTPYVYQGGNLLVGIENVEDNGFKYIEFYGQTVSGASISGRNASSTGIIPANQQNFIPKTTFGYQPTCVPKRLPYTYGFEDADDLNCWTLLNCSSQSGIVNFEDDHVFQFWYNDNPPQYLISPRFTGSTVMDMSFYYKNFNDDYPETFQVGYSTTTKSPNAFTWGDEVTANDQNTWMLYEDSFPVGTKYVAVKYNSYDHWMLFLDDFSFTPVFCPTEDQCELTFILTDSYGDGWNGAAIRVVDEETGIVLATMTNVTHDHANAPITETYTLAVCDGRELRFEWVSGSWNSECSYVVADANGAEIFSGSGAMSASVTYIVNCSGGQTIELVAGYNWVSTYIDGDPFELLEALQDGLGDNGVSIEGPEGINENLGDGFWWGDLDYVGINSGTMYLILVEEDCEVNLTGTPVSPSLVMITINPGYNWIGFTGTEEVEVEAALAGFEAEDGDAIEGPEGMTEYLGDGMWWGDFDMFVPGQGYMYNSASGEVKTLVFQTVGSKASARYLKQIKNEEKPRPRLDNKQ